MSSASVCALLILTTDRPYTRGLRASTATKTEKRRLIFSSSHARMLASVYHRCSAMSINAASQTANWGAMCASSHATQRRRIIPLTYLSLLTQCSDAWVQRSANRILSPRRHFSSARRHPIDEPCPQKDNTIIYAQDNDSLDLYKIVAEQDPEWYREFVVNVLGEDLLEYEELVSKNWSTLLSNKHTKRESPAQTSTVTSETTQSSPSQAVDDDLDEGSLDVVSVRNSTALEHSINATSAAEDQTDTNGSSTSNDGSLIGFPEARDTQSPATTGNVTLDASTIEPQVDLPETESEMQQTDADTTDTNGVLRPAEQADKRGDTFVWAIGGMPKPSKEKSDERISSARFSNHRKDETTKPTVASIKILETSKRPKSDRILSGISEKAGSSCAEQIAENRDTKIHEKYYQSQTDRNAPSAVTASTVSKQVKKDLTTSIEDISDRKPVDVGIGSDQSNYNILYRDLYTGELRAVNLTSVTNLGYSVSEIPYLQPDALALIVEDEIRKPSRGIPQQWQISQSQYEVLSDDVRVVPQEKAEELLVAVNGKKQSASKEMEYPFNRNKPDSDDDEGYEDDIELEDGNAWRQPFEKTSPKTPTAPTARENRRWRRLVGELQSTNTRSRQGREKKRIYNAREVSRKPARAKVNDPPPPDSPIWVDMDTFRDLLRREAGLRLRILGEDWADVVKDESNWRLSLYKEWLWALNKGIGNPLFPSRSDRVRERSPRGASSYKKRADGGPLRRPRADVKEPTRRRKRPDPDTPDETEVPERRRTSKTSETDINGSGVDKGVDSQSQETEEIGNSVRNRRPRMRERAYQEDDTPSTPRRTRQADLGPHREGVTRRRSNDVDLDDDDRYSRRRPRPQPGRHNEEDNGLTRRRSVAEGSDEETDVCQRRTSRGEDEDAFSYRRTGRPRNAPSSHDYDDF